MYRFVRIELGTGFDCFLLLEIISFLNPKVINTWICVGLKKKKKEKFEVMMRKSFCKFWQMGDGGGVFIRDVF